MGTIVKINNKSLHIEFYGLPGCGKSTVSHIIAERLRKDGYEIFEPTYEMDHNLNPMMRKLRKLWKTVKYLIFNKESYLALKKIITKCEYKSQREIWKQLVNIIPKIIDYNQNTAGVYIWDEGLIQSCISLTINSNIDIYDIISEILPSSESIFKIYLKTDKETALLRMQNRETNDSRIEKERNEMKRNYLLDKYYEVCESVNKTLCIQSTSVKISSEEIYTYIVKYLTNMRDWL